ncbi:MAG: imidazolonepropionase [Proteobacteria bacterium]|jgi:imidazolonepropionase|nr:imidazolonepropionase [Pseudomonadota bacterium]
MKEVDLIVRGASQVLTMEPPLSNAPEADADAREVGAILGGAIAIAGGRIADVGTEERILDTYRAAETMDAAGGVAAPGFVDPHTHAVFAGSRHVEFGMRMRGATYLEILAAGGGIHATVAATRAATLVELVSSALPRLERALALGVTTMEIKSGYGLDVDTEIKILEAVRQLDGLQPIRLVPTFLGAHVVPAEYTDRRDAYVDLLVTRVIPEVARRGLAAACDVFLDRGAFDAAEARAILEAGIACGLRPKIHAGQFTDLGGPELIAEPGGLSPDHLEVISDRGVAAMAAAGVTAVLLPGAAFSLRDEFPNGRRLADAGVRVALATDDNPGSSRTENLPLMASMGAARMGLTCSEAWRGITASSAAALGLSGEAGRLVAGARADVAILRIPDFRSLIYHFGVNHTAAVIVEGVVTVHGVAS